MKLNDFLTQLAEQFEDTDPAKITSECKFKELEEWSSLVALGIIAFVKMEFDKNLTSGDLRSCTTIKELYELITRK